MRIVKIESLPAVREQWIDRDEVMLHACFQILKDCVEKEKVDEHCNYEAHKEFVDEVRFLYTWWEKRRKGVQQDSEDNEDNDMLLRLMKIRQALWT